MQWIGQPCGAQSVRGRGRLSPASAKERASEQAGEPLALETAHWWFVPGGHRLRHPQPTARLVARNAPAPILVAGHAVNFALERGSAQRVNTGTRRCTQVGLATHTRTIELPDTPCARTARSLHCAQWRSGAVECCSPHLLRWSEFSRATPTRVPPHGARPPFRRRSRAGSRGGSRR